MDNFLSFLKSDFLQFFGFLIGIVGLLLSFLQYKNQENKKRLTYSIVLQKPFIKSKNNIEIIYGDKKIQDARLVTIKLQNSGNTVISPEDFISPLRLSFGENARILNSDVTSTSPKDIGVQINSDENFATINPILLNPHDFINVTFLVEQYSGNFFVDSQIKGIKEIKEGAE